MIVRREFILTEDEVKSAIVDYVANIEQIDVESTPSLRIRQINNDEYSYECILSLEDNINA